MPYDLLADGVVLVHAAFVLFVVLGGVFALRWRRAAWLHLPAVCWGAVVELFGVRCPLTPLENWLRARAHSDVYSGGFIERYLLSALYPEGLTRGHQIGLGVGLLLLNGLVYGFAFRRRAPKPTAPASPIAARAELDAEDELDSLELPIDGVLDLHLFRPADVKALVPDYLAACQERGITQVRIIHGKGKGTLRRTVHAVLQRLHAVDSFRLADGDAGGWGATLVVLKPPPIGGPRR